MSEAYVLTSGIKIHLFLNFYHLYRYCVEPYRNVYISVVVGGVVVVVVSSSSSSNTSNSRSHV